MITSESDSSISGRFECDDCDYRDFFDVDSDTYQRAYNVLDAQHNILEQLRDETNSLLNSETGEDRNVLEQISNCISALLSCDIGSIFPKAAYFVNSMNTLSNNAQMSPNTALIYNNLFTVMTILSRIFSYISCQLTTSKIAPKSKIEAPSTPSLMQENMPKTEEELVLCRICEEYVPVSMIESHSKNCVIAYESEYQMLTTDQKIVKLQNAIRKTILTDAWPGDKEETIKIKLPMLHAIMLLDVAISSNKGTKHDAEVLGYVLQSIESKIFTEEKLQCSSYIERGTELIAEKQKACTNFNEVSSLLEQTRVSSSSSYATPMQTTIADFEFVKRISNGAFARVFLARKRKTGDIYAIKVTPISSVKQKNQMRRCLVEKDILLQNTNPYIVNFYYSIVGVHNLYLVMEYSPGGDLYSLLQNVGCLDEIAARTYTVYIVKALEYLHAHGIIHRDIKPDNMLITETGTLKLTDFGLSLYGSVDRHVSETIVDDNQAFVGTPDYLSPEIILSEPHNKSTDFWSLGAVIYEFLTGVPPFHADTIAETFGRIIKCTVDWSMLEEFSPQVTDLIKKLLTVNPLERLGAKGINEIKNHQWFNGIDWHRVELLNPPFKPDLKDYDDTEYFTQRYSFQTTDDSDILDDMNQESKNQSSMLVSNLSARSSFAQRITDDDPLSHEYDDDDDISMFPSISLTKLSISNVVQAHKIRRCPRSCSATSVVLSDDDDGSLEELLGMGSNSFAEVSKVNGLPPKPSKGRRMGLHRSSGEPNLSFDYSSKPHASYTSLSSILPPRVSSPAKIGSPDTQTPQIK